MLELGNLSLPTDDPFGVSLKNIDLQVCAGEIAAVAGVAGNGQSELFDAISGENPVADNNAVKLSGDPCGGENITMRRRRNAAFVPEERIGHGAVPDFALSENVVLTHHSVGEGVVRNGLIDRSAAQEVNIKVTELFDVRKGSPIPRPARCPVAICKNSSSAGKSPSNPRSW